MLRGRFELGYPPTIHVDWRVPFASPEDPGIGFRWALHRRVFRLACQRGWPYMAAKYLFPRVGVLAWIDNVIRTFDICIVCPGMPPTFQVAVEHALGRSRLLASVLQAPSLDGSLPRYLDYVHKEMPWVVEFLYWPESLPAQRFRFLSAPPFPCKVFPGWSYVPGASMSIR